MKRLIENAYDFTFKKAFQAIDDWNYKYIDMNNLKRFFIKTSHIPSKQELVSILRRFDLDGDAKISFTEFKEGMKSNLTVFEEKKKKRTQSGTTINRPRQGL